VFPLVVSRAVTVDVDTAEKQLIGQFV